MAELQQKKVINFQLVDLNLDNYSTTLAAFASESTMRQVHVQLSSATSTS